MAEKKEEMYRVELIVSALLRIGVVLSAIIIVFGLVMLFITGESGYPGENLPDLAYGDFQRARDA